MAIYGQASYQSDVTKIALDVPGITVIPLAKDQYKIYAEVNQSIYDGGVINRTVAMHEAQAQVEDQKIEVDLYKIKDRINPLFFGVLLLDQQIRLSKIFTNDVETSLNKVNASIENGVYYKMRAQLLSAELLKIMQRDIELNASRSALQASVGRPCNNQHSG